MLDDDHSMVRPIRPAHGSGSWDSYVESVFDDIYASAASSAWNVVVSTAAHVVADDHQRIFCSAAATTDVTAPAPGGKVFMVTNTGTTGNVTVLPHAAETVNRAASYAVAPGASLTLADDNANWWGI